MTHAPALERDLGARGEPLALCGVSVWLAHRLLVGSHARHQASSH